MSNASQPATRPATAGPTPSASTGSAASTATASSGARTVGYAAGSAMLRPASAASAGDSYTVRPGDTLGAIAQRFYGDPGRWREIHRANEAVIPNPNLIHAGQVLTIPGAAPAAPAPAPAPAAAPVAAAEASYTVRSGDTLGGIAQRFYGDPGRWRDIHAANRGLIPNPNVIQVGQVLTIPGVAAPAPVSAAPEAAPEAPAPAMDGASYYTVRGGDSLSAIAGRLLGDGSKWRAIFEANRDVLSDPGQIHPGQRLLIPGWAGGDRAPPTNGPAPAPGGEAAADATPENVRRVAMQITNVFETGGLGGYAAINDYDAGIISYGAHQATLASGNLEVLLEAYLAASESDTSKQLNAYMGRVRAKDGSLRGDEGFKTLLRTAASETAMQGAQDASIISSHFNPAAKAANEWGISTPLGIAMLYDTNIQGGMRTCLQRARDRVGGVVGAAGNGGQITEVIFLRAFNEERRARLLELSAAAGPNTAQGRALATSVYRCDEFTEILDAGNLQLVGTLRVRGTDIQGLKPEQKPQGPETPNNPAPQPTTDKRALVLQKAESHLGAPYSWGGDGPSVFDCSGFVLYVLRQDCGLVSWGDDTAGGISNRLPATSSPKAGDLVFFSSGGSVQHIEIVMGSGTKTIGASGGGSNTHGNDPGAKVQYGSYTGDGRPYFFRSIASLVGG